MKYQHPFIVVEQPAPGHYAIQGLPPANVFIEGEGHVVAPTTCYISPTVPSDLLRAIIEDRGEALLGLPAEEQKPEAPAAPVVKKTRGRPAKVHAPSAEEQKSEVPAAGAGGSEEGDEFE